MTQLRIAETEKYAHVTFFFSGEREELFPGEERVLINSPAVATYELQPEMSAPELTDKLVEAITSGKYDLIVCNYANGDMVGHTGVYQAARIAVEAVDLCLGRIMAAVREAGVILLVTADHGNAEEMYETDKKTGAVKRDAEGHPKAKTAHTLNPVWFIVYDPSGGDDIAIDPGVAAPLMKFAPSSDAQAR